MTNQIKTVVDGSTESAPRTGDFEPLFTVVEACSILKISRRIFYRLVASGRLPALKVGAQLRIRPEDLRTFINTGGKKKGREVKDYGQAAASDSRR